MAWCRVRQSRLRMLSGQRRVSRRIGRTIVLSATACVVCGSLILADLSRPAEKQIGGRAGVLAIQIYQQKLHRFTHPFVRCRLQPTCSRFALIALREQGTGGFLKIAHRLWTCSRTAPLETAAPLSQVGNIEPRMPVALAVFQQNAPNPDAGCAACLAGTTGLVLLVLAWFGGGIALLVWVVRDAKNRGVESPILWMLLVFVLSLLGLIIYLLSRPGGNLVACEHCGNKKLQYARLCPHCGNLDSRSSAIPSREVKEVHLERGLPSSTSTDGSGSARLEANLQRHDEPTSPTMNLGRAKEEQAFCDQCGAKLDVGARFCDECGAKL
jgi:putative component of membrane protein insertase Oxa1/YidC/SpoIIIJ protein YidD